MDHVRPAPRGHDGDGLDENRHPRDIADHRPRHLLELVAGEASPQRQDSLVRGAAEAPEGQVRADPQPASGQFPDSLVHHPTQLRRSGRLRLRASHPVAHSPQVVDSGDGRLPGNDERHVRFFPDQEATPTERHRTTVRPPRPQCDRTRSNLEKILCLRRAEIYAAKPWPFRSGCIPEIPELWHPTESQEESAPSVREGLTQWMSSATGRASTRYWGRPVGSVIVVRLVSIPRLW